MADRTGELWIFDVGSPCAPAHEATVDTSAGGGQAIDVEVSGGWGKPVEGVRVRLRPDGEIFAATERPRFKIDLYSETKRDLPKYGPPLDEFEIVLDGERYRADYEFHGGLRSVGPSPATWREGL